MNNCPSCKVNLQGEPIPEENRKWYGNETHFSKKIGIIIRGEYDGVLIWKCSCCGHVWPRFEDRYLMEKAAKIIGGWNAC